MGIPRAELISLEDARHTATSGIIGRRRNADMWICGDIVDWKKEDLFF